MFTMDIQIGTPTNIWLLAIVAVGLVITGYAIIARRRAALKFATSDFAARFCRLVPTHSTGSQRF
jgi:hypothetical protein